MASLRRRIPRGHQHQGFISSERLSRGDTSFVSDTCGEGKVDIEAWGSRDIVLGEMAEKVCMFFGSLVIVTEIFAVVSRRGRGEEVATSRHHSSP